MLKSWTLCEMCPNAEFFWSVFSPNTEKYVPEKIPCLDAFHAVGVDTFPHHLKHLLKYYLSFYDVTITLKLRMLQYILKNSLIKLATPCCSYLKMARSYHGPISKMNMMENTNF